MVGFKPGVPRRKIESVYLIDGNHLAYRCFFSMFNLKTSKGVPSGSIFGFLRTLRSIYMSRSPSLLACMFDGPKYGLSYVDAHKLKLPNYEGYKANRTKPPQSFYDQLSDIQKVLPTLGIPVISLTGIEADALIGAYSRQFKDMEVYIVSSDHDLLQLLGKRIHMYDGIRKITFTEESFRSEHNGLPPMAIVDIKAMAGDSSDNIKGIPGIGEVKALKLLTVIYNTLTDICGKRGAEPPLFPILRNLMCGKIYCSSPGGYVAVIPLEKGVLDKFAEGVVKSLYKEFDSLAVALFQNKELVVRNSEMIKLPLDFPNDSFRTLMMSSIQKRDKPIPGGELLFHQILKKYEIISLDGLYDQFWKSFDF